MAMHGDAVPLFFYSDLFLRHPETRDLFPVSMAAQRDRLVHALGRIVSDVEHADALGEYLRGLGRDADGLYDLTDLEKMAARHPWLTVIPVVSDEPGFPGERGMLHEALARSGNWRGHDVYASGPTPMVEATVTQLMALGVPGARSISKTSAGVSHDRVLSQRPADTRSGAVDQLPPGPVRPPRPRRGDRAFVL